MAEIRACLAIKETKKQTAESEVRRLTGQLEALRNRAGARGDTARDTNALGTQTTIVAVIAVLIQSHSGAT